MIDTLSTYGYQFQVKIISALLTDKSFLVRIYEILDPEFFETKSLKFLCKQTLFYFREYRKVPTADVYKVQISGLSSDLDKKEAIKTFGDIWDAISAPDLDFVKSISLDFCKNQKLKSAILASVDFLKDGKYDEIKKIVDDAIKAGQSENIGHDYLVDIDARYDPDDQLFRVPTGWPVLDDLLGGGLPKGKLGIISMPSGYGKSFFLVCLAAHALKLGLNVFYYTLELDAVYVAKRIDAAITGIDLNHLENNVDEIKKRLSKVIGRLIIKEYATKRASLTTLLSHIDKLELQGIKPDLVIIDDPELLKIPELREQRKDEQIQELYEEIRGAGKEKDFAAWVPSQSNRSALQTKGPAGNDSISASYGKIFTADVVIHGDRRGKHKINNTALFNLAKNRFGPDGLVLPAKFDTAKAHIEIYQEIQVSDIEDDEDYKRELMAKKYMEKMSKREEPIF